METLLASVTLQVSVDDWPRSIDEGSATNETVGDAGGGGAGAGAGAGGGGGGGAGTFFLQPAANIASTTAKAMRLIFRLLNMNFASSTPFLFTPNGAVIQAVACNLLRLGAVGQHGPDLLAAAAI